MVGGFEKGPGVSAERPLEGRRIVVTRAREQAAPLVDRLAELGATAIDAPAIRIAEPPDPRAVERALLRVREYDLVIFTSQNAVHRVLEGLSAIGLEPTALRSGKVARPNPAQIGDQGKEGGVVLGAGSLVAVRDRRWRA